MALQDSDTDKWVNAANTIVASMVVEALENCFKTKKSEVTAEKRARVNFADHKVIVYLLPLMFVMICTRHSQKPVRS